MSAEALVLANLACAFFLTGLVWVLQVVHFPSMPRVGRDGFRDFARSSRARNTALMSGPMLIELIAAAWLAIVMRGGLPLFAGALVVVIWAVTWGRIAPLHARLIRGYDAALVRRLIAWNWARTAAWSLRSATMMWIVAARFHI